MGKMEKYVFGKAGLLNLITGLIFIFISIGVILYLHGMVSMMPEWGTVERAVVKEGALFLLYLSVFSLVTGVLGGYHIGRYLEMEFSKRRTGATSVKLDD